MGSFENEALETEDRSTKHPNLENEALENEDRSTKHPNLENEAPKSRKQSTYRKRSTQISKTKRPKTRKRRPQKLENEDP